MAGHLTPELNYNNWVPYYLQPGYKYETQFVKGSSVLLILTDNGRGIIPGYFIKAIKTCKVGGLRLCEGDELFIDLYERLISCPICYYETLVLGKQIVETN